MSQWFTLSKWEELRGGARYATMLLHDHIATTQVGQRFFEHAAGWGSEQQWPRLQVPRCRSAIFDRMMDLKPEIEMHFARFVCGGFWFRVMPRRGRLSPSPGAGISSIILKARK